MDSKHLVGRDSKREESQIGTNNTRLYWVQHLDCNTYSTVQRPSQHSRRNWRRRLGN